MKSGQIAQGPGPAADGGSSVATEPPGVRAPLQSARILLRGARLSRAAYLLRDYADMLDLCARNTDGALEGGADCQANIDDARSLADEFSDAARYPMVISQ